jgi:competence protein ComEA
MKWRQFVEDYLTFSKKDRIGLLCVVVIFALIVLIPLLFNRPHPLSIKESNQLSAKIDTLNSKKARQYVYQEDDENNTSHYQYEPSVKYSTAKAETFSFDPNTLPWDGWKRLGLNDRTIQTIEKYRTKGGRFYKPDDLEKIWGLPNGFYERVKDYIRIETPTASKNENFVAAVYSNKEEKPLSIEINSAKAFALDELPGIGNKLSMRIINFRDKLGGFYSVEQVRETYGLPDSVFQKIKPHLYINSEVKTLNINTASKDELKVHPYIKWNLANAIVEYRNQHGNYKSLDELKNISVIDEAAFKKISHYLVYNAE